MSDELTVRCGAADGKGRRLVVAEYRGLQHRDRFDVDEAFRRRKFREACIPALGLSDAPENHEVIESRLVAAADAEDARGDAASGKSAAITCLADVRPETVEWLWPGRIAIGKLTLLAGDPGLGKSLVTCDIAARVACGTGWPDDPSTSQPVGGVVLLSAEDDLGDTIRPRLDAHGADVTRIVALEAIAARDELGDYRRRIDLTTDLDAVEEAIDRTADCRLVVVDPVSAYLGRTDSHKNAEVRGVLSQLADLAARRRVALLAVTHLRKGEGPAVYRSLGSIGFVAAARAAWAVCRDQQDAERRLVLPIKNNLAVDVGGLAYAIRPYGPDDSPVVSWEADPVNISADEALAPPARKRGPKPTAVEEAAAWLHEKLTDGPLLAVDVKDHAQAIGISTATLRRASQQIGANPAKDGFDGPWYWSLEDDHEDAQLAPSPET